MAKLNWSNALSAAGGAAAAVGLEGIRASLEQQKVELASRLAGERELASDTRRETAAAAREERGYAQQGLLQKAGFAHSEALQKAGFERDEALLASRQAFDKEQKDLDRTLTREQITANERMRKLDRDNAMAIAKMGGVIQTDPEGNVYMVGKDGTTKQIMDPNDKTKPLKSAKDLTPAAKAYVDVLKDRLKAVDNNQLMDPDEKVKRTAALNEELLTTVTRGVGGLKKDDAPAGAPVTPKTQFEFDALPAGALYVNPRDGKTYRKKAAPSAGAPPALLNTPVSTAGVSDFRATNPGLIQWESQPKP